MRRAVCSEGVVASCGLYTYGRLSLSWDSPRVVRAWSRCLLFLNRLLLLLLLLLLAEAVHLLSPWVVGVLGLQRLLLETSLLRLLLVSVGAIPILEARLLRLHARRLVVGIVQEASLLRLLLLHRVAEPVHCGLLLVALVEASGLGSLRRCVIEEQTCLVLVVLLALS